MHQTMHHKTNDRLFMIHKIKIHKIKPRPLTLTLTLCLVLLWSAALSGCGVRKPPLPAKDIEKPSYPPR